MYASSLLGVVREIETIRLWQRPRITQNIYIYRFQSERKLHM